MGTEYAEIGPDLGCNKYRTLIQNASTKSIFVTALGERIEYVNIDSSKNGFMMYRKAE